MFVGRIGRQIRARTAAASTFALLMLATCTTLPKGTAIYAHTASPAPTTTPVSTVASNPLADTQWRLISLHGEDATEAITLSLTDRVFKGYMTCGQYGGASYNGMYVTKGDGGMTVHELGVGMRHCPTPVPVIEPEDAYIPTLRTAAQFLLVEDRLEFRDVYGRTVLVFAREGAPRYTCADMEAIEATRVAYESIAAIASASDVIVQGTVSKIEVVADQVRDRHQFWAVHTLQVDRAFKGGPIFGDTIEFGNRFRCMGKGGEYVLFLADRRDWTARTNSGFIDDPEKSDSPAEYMWISPQGEFLIEDGTVYPSAGGTMSHLYPPGSPTSSLVADILAAVAR